MYGFAISIAIKRRSAQIEQKVWQQGVPSCLVPIAVHAGMVTWAAIVASTVLWQLPATLDSLGDLAQVVRSLATGDATSGPDTQQWSFLPIRIATALPWFLAGATVSVLLAALLGGDVRRRGRQERVRDTIAMGFGLAFAVATAQLIQISFADLLLGQSASLDLVPIVGLAGFACGAVIGFVVPKACRDNLSAPPDPIMARALRDLSDQAEVTLGTRQAADDWIFQPRAELGGITPAEAVQYQAYANGVRRLLKQVAPRDVRAERGDRLRAVV
jgi:hypothetical protein